MSFHSGRGHTGSRELHNSFALKNSLVSFIPDLVEYFFVEDMTEQDFSEVFVSKLNHVKFYISQMSEELILENRKVFGNELHLADDINDIAGVAKDKKVDFFCDQLFAIIKKYNESCCRDQEHKADGACGKGHNTQGTDPGRNSGVHGCG